MKKIFMFVMIFGITSIAMAQEDQQPNDDQLQQQAPRETQVETERAARRSARNENDSTKVKDTLIDKRKKEENKLIKPE